MIEIIKEHPLHNGDIKAIIFDFDGTLSTLRYGWEKTMFPLMVEMIAPGQKNKELEDEVKAYIDESTGIQTIYQMDWLVEKIKQVGINKDVHDNWWYKDEYNRRLMLDINKRIESVKNGSKKPEDYLMKGSKEFLEALKNLGIKLCIASGTDDSDVKKEVEILGLTKYFNVIKGAPYRKSACSKEAVIKDIISENNFTGKNLAVFGDGKVEIALAAEYNALGVGVASNEEKLFGVNEVKRSKLIKAGANIIIDHFETEKLIKVINGENI